MRPPTLLPLFVGTYKDVVSNTDCSACTVGHYCPSTNLTTPTECGQGYYCDETGLSLPKQCLTGGHGWVCVRGKGGVKLCCVLACPDGKYCTGGSWGDLPVGHGCVCVSIDVYGGSCSWSGDGWMLQSGTPLVVEHAQAVHSLRTLSHTLTHPHTPTCTLTHPPSHTHTHTVFCCGCVPLRCRVTRPLHTYNATRESIACSDLVSGFFLLQGKCGKLHTFTLSPFCGQSNAGQMHCCVCP
jgi:hypothetical protein